MTQHSSEPSRPEPSPVYRWLVLLSCSAAMFANYYVFDALYPVFPLLETAFGFSGEQLGLLDTAYNVAALLTLIGGGVLIDRLGTAKSTVIFAGVGASGSLLIALLPALLPNNAAMGMMAGRFVLGVGSELFIVAGTTVVGRWFKGREISFALAIQLLVARCGSLAADQSPNLGGGVFDSWQPPLLIAAALGGVWLLFAIVYSGLEKHAARRFGKESRVSADKLVLRDLVQFARAYWWVVGLCVAFYATIFPFRSFANVFLIDFHSLSNAEAGELKSVLPLISMIGMPLFGLLVDRIGKRALLMMAGSALLVPPFLLMAYTHLPLWVSMGMLGLAFALVPAVLWPAVTYIVPDARLGSAYALMTFCQQLGWAGMAWGIGKLKDSAGASASNPEGWIPVMWMLAALAGAGFIFALLLWRDERRPGAHGLESAKVDVAVAAPSQG